MKRLLLIFHFSLFTFHFLFADAVLDKFIHKLENEAFQSNLTIRATQNGTPIFMKGYLRLYGDRFYVKYDNLEMAYNGDYLSTYQADFNEITWSTPSQAELNENSPIWMIRQVAKDSQVKTTQQQNGHYRIVLTTTNAEFAGVQFILTCTASYTPIEFTIKGKDDTSINIHFDDLEYMHTVPVFEIIKPNATINDLR